MGIAQSLSRAADTVLDRTVVLGYTRVGSGLRSRWWPGDPAPDALAGRRVLVTGATSGIGEAAIEGYLALGATVHLLGRNAAKVEAAVAATSDPARVVGEVCDVGDLDDVRRWAADFTSRVPELAGLLHNAGTMTGQERVTSVQDHELSLAVHVLGPHLITGLLRAPLEAGAAAGGASVVWMSSGGMYSAKLEADDADDIEFRRGEYDGVRAYARTKRMQVVLADQWSRALAGTGVEVESMHPGWSGTPGVKQHLPRFEKLTRPFLRTPQDAADTAVWLVATRPASTSPHFWHDRAQRPVVFPGQSEPDRAAVARLVEHVVGATGMPLPG
ncbi:dehydrogenase [Nocardioides sp. Root190]|uniref:SDR family NAD(P)-dependent oxidoreductase n=1 Tax=Nocardioides sp. Root190 TaxID=1736488 RepID=UPI0006FDC995|nr:SDR family NAD(P)-dependent oxidoreductase [Nocardioides sp. Root190]KRB76926.1 dehydrogenase [Nocardioides sp. Root190]